MCTHLIAELQNRGNKAWLSKGLNYSIKFVKKITIRRFLANRCFSEDLKRGTLKCKRGNRIFYSRIQKQKNFCKYKCNSLNILPFIRSMVLSSVTLFYCWFIFFLSSGAIQHSSPLSPGGYPVTVCGLLQ